MVLAVIPARFASTRLPGKPLLPMLSGEPMIAHVVRQALSAASVRRVLVATDHVAIAEAAEAAGAEPVMTDSALPTGTDRVAAALRVRSDVAMATDVIVNVQGDEPLVQPAAIDLAARLLHQHPTADIATLGAPLPVEALLDAAKVKIVCGPPITSDGDEDVASTRTRASAAREALFFSRAPIGVQREALQGLLQGRAASAPSLVESGALLHVGLYAFRPAALQRFVQLPPSRLERLEQLEQLRALEAGMSIVVGEHPGRAHAGVDTLEDVSRLERLWHEASAEDRQTLLGRGARRGRGADGS